MRVTILVIYSFIVSLNFGCILLAALSLEEIYGFWALIIWIISVGLLFLLRRLVPTLRVLYGKTI